MLHTNGVWKIFRSENYNYNFNMRTGLFVRWGKTKDDDPMFAPAPEIADIEISTICHGPTGVPCHHCYKSNTGRGKNMSFMTFRDIFLKFPESLTQIAFGIGDIDGNPDLWDIMDYCRNNTYNTVIPNITINGGRLTDEHVKKLAHYCGAVACSYYAFDEGGKKSAKKIKLRRKKP